MTMYKRATSHKAHAIKRATCRTRQSTLFLFAVLFFYLVVGCAQKDDEAAIRAVIQKGAALAESHDISSLMALATADIVAQPGGYTRLEIKRIVWSALMHYGQIKIIYPKPSVALSAEGDRASCQIYLLIVKKDRVIPDVKDLYDDPRGWLETVGDNADLYQLKLEMLKTGRRWQIRKARLGAFTGTGFSG